MPNSNVSEIIQTSFVPRETVGDFQIGVVAVNELPNNGVEVFARVWDKDGRQYGFGADGTVDIERFKIYNPPVHIPDENGGVLRKTNKKVGKTFLRFAKNPKKALLQEIAHTVAVKKQKSLTSKIKPGTIGNTTSTFYSHTSDSVWGFGNVASWASARTTYWFMDNDDAFESSLVQKQSDGDWAIYRIGVSFDTSSIGTDTISSATVSFAAERADHNDFNDGLDYWAVCDFSPASHTSYVSGDGDNTTYTEQHDSGERIDFSSITVNGYNDYSLNSTGIGNINKSGYTGFMFLEGHDIQDTAPSSPTDGDLNRITIYLADNTGTTYDPKLVVEHAAGGVIQPQFLGYAGP